MKRPLKRQIRIDQNAHYFQALGLRRGECRVDVIRQAARERAKEFSGRSHPATVDLHRAEVAVATYRLLDPRGRTQLYERIQLSCPIDQIDQVMPVIPSRSPINRTLDFHHTTPAGSERNGVQEVRMMEGAVVERAIAPSDSDEEAAAKEGECSLSDPTPPKRTSGEGLVELKKEPIEETCTNPNRTAIDWIRSFFCH